MTKKYVYNKEKSKGLTKCCCVLPQGWYAFTASVVPEAWRPYKSSTSGGLFIHVPLFSWPAWIESSFEMTCSRRLGLVLGLLVASFAF